MREENTRMQEYLAKHGIHAKVKYIWNGSLKGCWRLYNPSIKWNPELESKLTALGFKGFDGKPLDKYSGNGGLFSVFVRGHKELLEGQSGEGEPDVERNMLAAHGRRVQIDLTDRDNKLPDGSFSFVKYVGYDGKHWDWADTRGGMRNGYSDESRFRYSLGQELMSQQKASQLMERLQEEYAKKNPALTMENPVSKADRDYILRLLDQQSGASQGALNGIALRLGLATPQTDAATVNERLREVAEAGDVSHIASEILVLAKELLAVSITVGDKVKYARKFLQSIGAYTDLGHWTGTVTDIKNMGSLPLANVDWSSGESGMVNVNNLVLVSRLHLEASEKVALDVFQQHQKKIAISTLKMSDMGANIMGGMSKDEARAFLKSIGYSDSQIAKIENS